jgi:hypothetical protein
LNWDIVGAMLTVKESMLTDGTVAELADDADAEAEELAELDELDELDELQAAAVRARSPRPTQPSRRKRRNVPSPCVREDRPPLLLLLTRIPHTFRRNVSE